MGGLVDDIVSVGTFGLVDTDFGGKEAGKNAARAAQAGAQMSADAQREALAYLKEKEALPMQYRDQALRDLSRMTGQGFDQQELIDQAKSSPLYASIMGGRGAGEESIARNASATGGFRSGNMKDAMYKYNTELENNALLQSYNQANADRLTERSYDTSVLQGLARTQSYAPQIAQGTANIGATLGQGHVAAVQSDLAAQNAGFNQLMGLGQVGMAGAAAFSDIRLKENIKLIESENGVNLYSWDWNDEAANVGLFGSSTGFMAHEIYEFKPEIIGFKDGYITITLPEAA